MISSTSGFRSFLFLQGKPGCLCSQGSFVFWYSSRDAWDNPGILQALYRLRGQLFGLGGPANCHCIRLFKTRTPSLYQMFFTLVIFFGDKMRSFSGIAYLHTLKRSVSFSIEYVYTWSLDVQYTLWQVRGTYLFQSVCHCKSTERRTLQTGNKNERTRQIGEK